jgi:hypothetical protein
MAPALIAGRDSINTSDGVLHLTRFGWASQIGRPAASAPRSPADVGFLSGAYLVIPPTTWAPTDGFPAHFFTYGADDRSQPPRSAALGAPPHQRSRPRALLSAPQGHPALPRRVPGLRGFRDSRAERQRAYSRRTEAR